MGASLEAPENTLSAFYLAQEMGAEWIEFDVRVTQDGIPVIVHDGSLGWDFPIPESHPIKALTFEELSTFDLGGWFHQAYLGETAPTLETVLQRDLAHYLVEIKWPGPNFHSDVDAIITLLQSHGKRFIVGCMIPELLAYIQERYPEIPLCGIVQSQKNLPLYLEMSLQTLALRQQLATPEILELLKERSIEAWVWTVDDPNHASELHKLGIDGVITNNIRRMLTHFSNENK